MENSKKELNRTILAQPPEGWSEYVENYDIFQEAQDNLERAKRAIGHGGRNSRGEFHLTESFVTE